MPLRRFFFAFAFLSIASTGLHAQVSTAVEVTGAVRQSLRVDAVALAAFPAEAIVQFAQTLSDRAAASVVRGVKLAALVDRAGGLSSADRNAWKTLVVIATATDGYKAVFSWPEITNTAIGDGVLVLFERDGNPLDEREGRIALMSTADRQAGPRRVRNLVRIELRPAE